MSINKSPVSWFGIALVIFGAGLLLNRLNILDVRFSTIFWCVISLLGLVTAARGFSGNVRWKIFWGTLWFLYGMFFFLSTSELVETRGYTFVPASFLILGIAFLMMYFNNVQDWFFLVLAVVFGGIGTLATLAELDYLSRWELHDALQMYWPIILILFGLAFILRRRNSQQSGPAAPAG
jgi:hypothetical protein